MSAKTELKNLKLKPLFETLQNTCIKKTDRDMDVYRLWGDSPPAGLSG